MIRVETFTVDSAGYVLIAGARVVNNARGDMLKHRPHDDDACRTQRGGGRQCPGRVAVPMQVVSEFEAAMGQRKYWNRAIPSSGDWPTRCAGCVVRDLGN